MGNLSPVLWRQPSPMFETEFLMMRTFSRDFVSCAPIPETNLSHVALCATLSGEDIYCFGGRSHSGTMSFKSFSVHCYSVGSNRWEKVSFVLRHPHFLSSAVATAHGIYLAGGTAKSTARVVEFFDVRAEGLYGLARFPARARRPPSNRNSDSLRGDEMISDVAAAAAAGAEVALPTQPPQSMAAAGPYLFFPIETSAADADSDASGLLLFDQRVSKFLPDLVPLPRPRAVYTVASEPGSEGSVALYGGVDERQRPVCDVDVLDYLPRPSSGLEDSGTTRMSRQTRTDGADMQTEPFNMNDGRADLSPVNEEEENWWRRGGGGCLRQGVSRPTVLWADHAHMRTLVGSE